MGGVEVRGLYEGIQAARVGRRLGRWARGDEERWEDGEVARIRQGAVRHRAWMEGAVGGEGMQSGEGGGEDAEGVKEGEGGGDPYGYEVEGKRSGGDKVGYPDYVKDTLPRPYSREDVREDAMKRMTYRRPSVYGKLVGNRR